MISQLPTEYDAPAPEMLTPTGAEYSFEFISKALTAVKYSLPITEKIRFSEPGTAFRLVGNVAEYRLDSCPDWITDKRGKGKVNWEEVTNPAI
ncbi:hypothetical protein M0657_010810 [Pyricularia oryzae]|nr:hypothetical protein M0657_010810 [Pyricularia oryzae]KAI7928882.1 hypothetical protein M9X92_001461 [Pyricularia oryzae]